MNTAEKWQLQVKDILEKLNREAPFKLAEEWDNVGLLVGNKDQEISGIIAGLDPTTSLIDEAVSKNCNTIITHHPVIFKPLSSIDTAVAEGRLLQKALQHQLCIIGYHTNFDSANEGVSDVLGRKLQLEELTPLILSHEAPDTGLGRIGSYPQPVEKDVFVNYLGSALGLEAIHMAGRLPETIQKVAICGGSGSEFAQLAKRSGADVYISAEIKHSTAVWANENDFCIIDGTHYATEKPAIEFLVNKLKDIAADAGWQIDILLTETEKHPFSVINLQ